MSRGKKFPKFGNNQPKNNAQGNKPMNSNPQKPQSKPQQHNKPAQKQQQGKPQQKGNKPVQNQPQQKPQQQQQQQKQKQQPQQQKQQQQKQPIKKKEVFAPKEESDNGIASINPEIVAVEEELNKVEMEYEKELSKLSHKMDQKRQPLYQKRRELFKKINNFWPTVFQKHTDLSSMLDGFDEEALNHLTDLHVDFQTAEKFTLVLGFSSNAYFTNTQLQVEVNEEGDLPTLKADTVQWKAGKSPFEKKKGTEDKKRKEMEYFGFFSLFEASKDDEQEKIDLLKIIATDLFPDALSIYLSEMDDSDFEFDSDRDMSDDEEFDEEDDMSEGDDDDEDNEDDDESDEE